jgi:hypothetical protein
MAGDDIYIVTKVTPTYETYARPTYETYNNTTSWWTVWCGLLCVALILAFVGWGLYAIIEAFTPEHCSPGSPCNH